jgi:O-antigen/teichoic acid export membrane protein
MTSAPPRAEKDSLRAIFGNAGVLLGGKGFNALLSLGYLAAAGRALGAEQFGLLVMVHAYALAISDLSKFQSWQVVLHYGHAPYTQGRLHDLQRVLRFSTLLDVISAVAGLLLAWAGIALFGDWLNWPPSLQGPACWYMTSIVFMVNTTPTGVLRLIDRFDLLALRSSGGSLVRFVGALVCWWLDGGLGAFMIAWYLATVSAFAGLVGSCGRQVARLGLLTGFQPFKGPLTEGFPRIWRFVWSTNLGLTLSIASSRLPMLLVGGLLGPAEAGMFRVAKQLADGIGKPAKLIVVALYPELVRKRDDWRHLVQLSRRIAWVCGGVSTGLLTIVAVIGGPALGLIVGPEFREGGTVLTLLAASAVFGIWGLPLEPLLISVGGAGSVVRARLIVLSMQLPLFYLLTRHFGLVGAGSAAIFHSVSTLVALYVPVLRWYRRKRAVESSADAGEAP